MRFNYIAKGKPCLVDVDLQENKVAVYSGNAEKTVLARYSVSDVKFSMGISDLYRAEAVAKFALQFFESTSHLGTEIQGIKYREQSPGFEGALTLVQ